MATRYYGTLVTASTLVHTGAGRLYGVLISNVDEASQNVIIYDNTSAAGTKLFDIDVPPALAPVQFDWRAMAMDFSTGLYVVPGSAKVHVWAVGN